MSFGDVIGNRNGRPAHLAGKAVFLLLGKLADLFAPSGSLVNGPLDAGEEVGWSRAAVRCERPAETAVQLEWYVDDVPARVLSVAYVVIREALANAAKYAGAGKVSVSLSAIGGELSVSVFDGGRGFTSEDERAAREAHHFGLVMLRRRVREAGGRLVVESTPGRGTEVLARIPIREERR